ncbi:LOW QUALITY PROTEIN: L10-interacting MYB domain-containing protein [Arabidopsis lyrata subsp. lyrata]|uniref:LOW QUALITY PROTEIN: L10-interacting MYB domain-containing protein n=1 Tax=Arabidopsis lyrata subsp. lyrata TaxID=81972 RepID=UPI000A29D906|nr:LOW QUALITY PROTEIN: L10-interacting MYB domain-containing protein [Arabidopsis lyrata subsp. lyrata]|eukprot:XP_020887810.1 LOW QUALITY PROTEIN: L10-interacting MYB domain-containing protein [Arabidopsis lyrata subsp. lyrata]
MTSKAAWEPEHEQVFVDFCVEQKMLGNQPEMQHILEAFKEMKGVRFTKDQLMNRWDTMIKQWKIWCRLVQRKDMKWDLHTNTFGASDQEWANYLEMNLEAGQYRCNPPLFLKKLEIIFAGINLDGEGTSSGSKMKQLCEHHDEENDNGYKSKLSASDIAIRRRFKWPPSSHAIFVDVCFQESIKGTTPTRRNQRYTKEAWKMILEEINRITGVGYTHKQLESHFERTRTSWKNWCKTIASPIMKWDANTRKFGATEEDWDTYLKVNKKAAVFRWRHIPHADKLATIFKGRIEPGKTKTRRYRKRVIDHHSESPQLHDHQPAPSSVVVYTNEPVTGSDNRADDAEPTPLIRSDSEDVVETVTSLCDVLNTMHVSF